MRRRTRHTGARCRWRTVSGEWRVRARVERFVEPALLVLLGERRAHGYDLLEQLPELAGEERLDMGNLYRLLRALEREGLVASEWRDDVPGPAKRVYELTDEGGRLLERWAKALTETQEVIARFLSRYGEGRR
jgi:PadR family transcriptional regulator, regulatory protein PadR